MLGCRLVRRFADGREFTARIVETEAYGPGDPSSHAYRGRSNRNGAMFARPGTLYVYKIYGMYYCLNVSTESEGVGAAVLIRGLDGIADADGPGKLCRALDIDLRQDGLDGLAKGGELELLSGSGDLEPIVTTTRIGISSAADWHHRFYLLGSRGVSRRDRAAERKDAS